MWRAIRDVRQSIFGGAPEPPPESFTFPPFRQLDDFTAKFSIPSSGDKLEDRVYYNLIYYQTNYLAIMALLFGYYLFTRPTTILVGGAIIVLCLAVAPMARAYYMEMPRERGIIALVAGGVFVLGVMSYVSETVLAVGLPLLLALLHALLRKRNILNRAQVRAEMLGLRSTPMGYMLRVTGLEPPKIWD